MALIPIFWGRADMVAVWGVVEMRDLDNHKEQLGF